MKYIVPLLNASVIIIPAATTTIGRSVRSTTASVIQIPTTTTPTTHIIPNRREMREVP